MLHTLLPTSEKKILRHEYQIRALVVLSFIVSVAVLIGIVALFPTFVKVFREGQSLENSLASVSIDEEPSGEVDCEKDLKSYNLLLSALVSEVDFPRLSTFVEMVVAIRHDVILDSVSVAKLATSSVAIMVNGKANTRDSLITFKKRLEETDMKVDLPVSALAKSRDISFSMKITKSIR
jgi:hypothetical protein